MNDIFTKFYSNYIQDIHDFLDSNSDVLYISGFSGSGKSSVLKTALSSYKKDILNFHHLCFKNTVIDDFLLSFYDSFREHAIKQRIALKKNPEEGFMQKVNFYFKNLEYPAIVIIDNFEMISDDSEITDFLLHISGFENVKIIIISKNPTCRLAESPTVSIQRIDFEKIEPAQFREVLTSFYPNAEPEDIQELYQACGGYELYIKMSLTYLDSVSLSLSDFMTEFRDKSLSFEEFIIGKQISLIPNTYYPILENLSCIHHNIPPLFIETYGLGDIKQLSYLISKFAISEFFGTYYIKSYLRRYFSENLSIQNKINIFEKNISIYENELKKSPKDRILRLSRESIRNQISLLEENIPKVQRVNSTPAFNYVAQAITSNPQWFVTGVSGNQMRGMSPKVKKNQRPPENKINAEEPTLFEKKLASVIGLEGEYHFKEALSVLFEMKPLAKKLADKITVYSKTASDSLKINDNNTALLNLRELCEICSAEGDINSYSRFRIEIGKIYKKMYAFSRAKACFEEIIEKEGQISERTLASARLSLGEIFELENNMEDSLLQYEKSFELVLSAKGESDILLPEICYKMASIYDENGYFDEALGEYEKSIKYAETSGNDVYLLKCYSSSGVILADMGQTETALSYLEYAFDSSKDTDNYIDTYYIARSIAEIYKNIDSEKSYEYLTEALEYARLSDNSFEIAISLLELGDFYYDSKQNEQALICYFQAKKTLGNSASKENLERLTTRINDMKIKLGDYVFRGMQQLYDSD